MSFLEKLSALFARRPAQPQNEAAWQREQHRASYRADAGRRETRPFAAPAESFTRPAGVENNRPAATSGPKQSTSGDCFGTSMAVGAVTDNAIVGALVGGSIVGGVVGTSLSHSSCSEPSVDFGSVGTSSPSSWAGDDGGLDSLF